MEVSVVHMTGEDRPLTGDTDRQESENWRCQICGREVETLIWFREMNVCEECRHKLLRRRPGDSRGGNASATRGPSRAE